MGNNSQKNLKVDEESVVSSRRKSSWLSFSSLMKLIGRKRLSSLTSNDSIFIDYEVKKRYPSNCHLGDEGINESRSSLVQARKYLQSHRDSSCPMDTSHTQSISDFEEESDFDNEGREERTFTEETIPRAESNLGLKLNKLGTFSCTEQSLAELL